MRLISRERKTTSRKTPPSVFLHLFKLKVCAPHLVFSGQANGQYRYSRFLDRKCDHLQLPYCIWMLLQPRRKIVPRLLGFLECEIDGKSSWSTKWERSLPKRLALWVSHRCSLQKSILPASYDTAGYGFNHIGPVAGIKTNLDTGRGNIFGRPLPCRRDWIRIHHWRPKPQCLSNG